MHTYEITVTGLVQGVGFRPFVAELAEKYHIVGSVRNAGGIVILEAFGEQEAVDGFVEKIRREAPKGARVEEIHVREIVSKGPAPKFFSITESTDRSHGIPFIPADIATCDRCEREFRDKASRRFHHGFISCVSCGPRYSILEALPYDRPRITMKEFELCPICGREYVQQGNVRRHAQTICCPECGPEFSWKKIEWDARRGIVTGPGASDRLDGAVGKAAECLRAGGIVAVKDIGGYHLACDPKNKEAVAALRRIKGRETKPFAVCFPDEKTLLEYCELNGAEREALKSPARPIVLLRKRAQGLAPAFSDSVCGTSPDVGAMLPCNPQQLLLTELCGPLVMTSGNGSGDLLLTENDRMEEWLRERASMCGVSLGMLSHNRRILTPLDDSVVRVVEGRTLMVRRARGYVPEPVPFPGKGEAFGAGGDLKAAFCYTKQGRAYLSAHLGDLENLSGAREYLRQAKRMESLFGFNPGVCGVDLHPGYASVGLVKDLQRQGTTLSGKPVLGIQHHKAHVASVVAEHHLKGTVLGFAFDGTGYGEDKTIWGSEVFLWEDCERTGAQGMNRIGHLLPVRLIGGNEGARNGDTILMGYLANGGQEGKLLFSGKQRQRYQLVERAIDLGMNTVVSTSMGRLFDAVSALLDCCHYNGYEGEAPIELENLARTIEEDAPFMEIGEALTDCNATGEGYVLDTGKLFARLTEEVEQCSSLCPESRKKHYAVLARGFINLISEYIIAVCNEVSRKRDEVSGKRGEKADDFSVALSGGTFHNRILLERTIRRLEARGYRVYLNEQVPCSDGGLCLGQAYLALFSEGGQTENGQNENGQM